MENLIEEIQAKLNKQNKKTQAQTQAQVQDGMIVVQSIKELHIDTKILFNPKLDPIDFASMKFNEIVHVIKENKRLQSDYFKFELYMTLTKEDFSSLINQFFIPYKCMKNVFRHIITFQNPNEMIMKFISKNKDNLTEDIKLVIIKNCFKLKKPSQIIEEITGMSIDSSYMMDLITQNEKYQIEADNLVTMMKIILKKNRKNDDWLNLIKNLLTIAVIQKKMKPNDYTDIIANIDEHTQSIVLDKGVINEEDPMLEGWNTELHNKLINKKGVLLESITI